METDRHTCVHRGMPVESHGEVSSCKLTEKPERTSVSGAQSEVSIGNR